MNLMRAEQLNVSEVTYLVDYNHLQSCRENGGVGYEQPCHLPIQSAFCIFDRWNHRQWAFQENTSLFCSCTSPSPPWHRRSLTTPSLLLRRFYQLQIQSLHMLWQCFFRWDWANVIGIMYWHADGVAPARFRHHFNYFIDYSLYWSVKSKLLNESGFHHMSQIPSLYFGLGHFMLFYFQLTSSTKHHHRFIANSHHSSKIGHFPNSFEN